MKISIICVGKLKEKYWTLAVDEYIKRLGRFCNVEILELSDEKAPDNMSLAEEKQLKDKEGNKILKAIKAGSYVVSLDLKGKEMTSVGFSEFIEKSMINGTSHISFVIGGSIGLSKDVLNHCDYSICFSKMTFPHQLMRVILLEQIYRCFKIINNETYHK